MKTTCLSGVLACSLLACAALVACASQKPSSEARPAPPPSHHKGEPHDWWHSSVTIENSSDWAIQHIYLSPFDAVGWGADQLTDTTIKKGERLELKGIDCDTYDIKIVDEAGDECIVQDIDLCLQDATWSLDNDELVGCQSRTAVKGRGN
jgi:hypothetical protein